jgi:radical SAM protein with 4Fe4S-binding SPASM domain
VCPGNVPSPADFDWMIARGFQRINFNMNWLDHWTAEDRIKLQEFARWVARRCIQSMRGELTIGGKKKFTVNSNLMAKFHELHLKDMKPPAPCGTGRHMLALTPEGYLYPSQEMAFKAFEPGVAPGTKEHYMVGNIWHDPVIDTERLEDVASIKNSEMKTPEGFDCGNCAANPISFGGCHCRYIGQDGHDPSNRHTVAPGWCQSTQAWVAGMLLGARIEKYTTLKTGASSRPGVSKPQESGPHDMHVHEQPNNQPVVAQSQNTVIDFPKKRLDLSDLHHEIMQLKRMLKTDQLKELQAQLQDMDQIMRPVSRRLNREDSDK